MLTDRPDQACRIHFLQIFETFGVIIRNEWLNLIIIGIILNLVPSILFDWFAIDPQLRVDGTLWRYSVGGYFVFLCNGAFSVLIVRVGLSVAKNLDPVDDRLISIYGRFLLFSVLADAIPLIESSLSLVNPDLAHFLAKFIQIPNLFIKMTTVALFGAFLPTLFEGVTFRAAIRKSYQYLSGYRVIAIATYALVCALDFIPLPIIEILHPSLLFNMSSDKNNIIALYAIAKLFSMVFEISWLIIVSSFYLLIRRRGYDQQSMASLFD